MRVFRVVAIVAGAIGYFVVLRGSAFAAHALSHIGFAGATGAVVLALSPIVGLLAFTLGAGIAIGALGSRLRGRDVTIGIVLDDGLHWHALVLPEKGWLLPPLPGSAVPLTVPF